MGASDSTRSSSGRALSRFKPRRLASVLRLASSTPSIDKPGDNNGASTPRSPCDEASLAAFIPPQASASTAAWVITELTGENRRSSGESRAAAANEARRILAIETAPGKRRKSLIELEEMMDGLEHATLAPRRRSSPGPLQPLATSPFRAAIDDFDFTPTSQCDRTSATSNIPLPNIQPFLASRAYQAFPSSPTMPSISPSTPGCSRFSDEPISPYLEAPQTPRTPQSPVSSPVSLASATFATASPPRNPRVSLKPRSPRAFYPHEPLLADDPLAQKAFVRSPSGIDMRFPLVFPSRSTPSTRTNSTVSIRSGTAGTWSSTVNSVVEDEEEASSSTARSTRMPKPFFVSPFPPPCISVGSSQPSPDMAFATALSTRHRASDHVQQSSPSRRPSVASSSYTSTADDGRGSSLYSPPDTFGLRNSPLPTTVTIVLDDPFSAAFAAGTA